MCWNLLNVFLCFWALLGFIGYGIAVAQGYDWFKKEKFITKILLMLGCMAFGPAIIAISLDNSEFRGLRFW